MTFNEGDRVIHKTRLDRGTVVDGYDGIAYIELDNGVEMDFPVAELMLEEEYKSPHELRQEEMAAADEATLFVAELILPEVRNIFVALAMKMADEAGAAVIALGGSASPWEKSNAFHKMNFISVATNTRFIDWVNAHNDDRMTAFQLEVLLAMEMAVGII